LTFEVSPLTFPVSTELSHSHSAEVSIRQNPLRHHNVVLSPVSIEDSETPACTALQITLSSSYGVSPSPSVVIQSFLFTQCHLGITAELITARVQRYFEEC
jgi:hypothetical protein